MERKALLLDCDGVLVDSEDLSCGAWIPVLARYGIQTDLAEIRTFLGKSTAAVLEHFRRSNGRPLPDSLGEEKEAEYYRLADRQLQCFPGAPEVLERLARSGWRLAVASSGTQEKIRFSLEHTGLLPLFESISSAAEVTHGKPAPDLFLLAAQRLGLPAQACVVVEDSLFGIEAALGAGMAVVGFASSFPPQALCEAGAAQVVHSYRELEILLQDWGREGPAA